LADSELEELCGVLLRKFVDHDGDPPKRFTPNERRQVKAKAKSVGRDKFSAAVDAWLADHPWDAITTNPLIGFISGFEGYVAKVGYNAKVKNRRLTQDQIDRIGRISKIRHHFFWLPEDLDDEGRAFVKGMVDRDNATWTDHEIDRALMYFRDGERLKEQEPDADAIFRDS
jgi:hypothetical protein